MGVGLQPLEGWRNGGMEEWRDGVMEGTDGYNTLGNTVTFSGTKVFLSVTELLKALLVV